MAIRKMGAVMPDTVKIPGVGPVNKKYAYIGVAAVAGFVGFAYYRSRNSAATDTTATDPNAVDTTSTDPTTYDPSYSGYSADAAGYMGSVPSYYPPYGSSSPISTGAPATDSAWTQATVNYLAEVGVDSQAASHALGLYMADLCMTNQEADYVRQGIAGMNQPPQSHHDIKICPTSPGDPGSGSPTKPSNLHVTGTSKSSVSVAWTAGTGTKYYMLHIDGGGISHSVSTSRTDYTISGLKAKTTYHLTVAGITSTGTTGATSPVSATTKAK